MAVLAACGGGGGGGSTTPSVGGSNTGTTSTPTPAPVATPTLAAGQAYAHISITLPSTTTSSTTRRAQYVAPGTASLELTLLTVNGAAVTSTMQGPFNTASGDPGCATSGSSTTCTFTIAAPIGTDVFLANTFSQAGGVDPLGSGAVSFTVQANATNAADLTLTGPVNTAVIVSDNDANSNTLWDGNGEFFPFTYAGYEEYENSDSKGRVTPQRAVPLQLPSPIPSQRVYVIAQDSQQNTIFNPTSYNQPVILTLNLNGGSANSTLTDTPPAGLGCGPATQTSVDGGTVTVCSPFDVITLTLVPSVQSTLFQYEYAYGESPEYDYYNFPYLSATLPGGTATFQYTTEVTTTGSGSGSLPVTVQ